MKQQIEQRLGELRAELDAGQRMLTDLDTRRADLQATMLRISGAIQVLEELLNAPADAASAGGRDPVDLASAAGEIG